MYDANLLMHFSKLIQVAFKEWNLLFLYNRTAYVVNLITGQLLQDTYNSQKDVVLSEFSCIFRSFSTLFVFEFHNWNISAEFHDWLSVTISM